MAACYVPFNSKNVDMSFFVFKPTVVIVENLVHGLKKFSSQTQSLGCLQSSIFRSIHGNLIIWYGAWQKRSSEKKEQLTETLLSMLKGVSSMGVLVEHSFLDTYAGESRDGASAAKFCSGDIITMNSVSTTNKDLSDLCYAVLALFRSRFARTEGIASGLCLKGQSMPRVICIQVWKSLQFCYSWILNFDHRKWVLPYLERFSTFDIKYDIYRVVYVSGDINNNNSNHNGVNLQGSSSSSHHQMLENNAEESFTDRNTRLDAKTY
ncbi:hypothetical protein K1719_025799 [Acacia pycnantha]|nr:hypothetical protein K1719_025799 [Acacia pycnantha]